MRETLINNKPSFKITEVEYDVPDQKLITDVMKGRGVSVELCPNENLDFVKLKEGNFKFVSVTWFRPSSEALKNPENIPAIGLAKKLISEGYHVLLHLTGRNLSKGEAINVLNCVESLGIRNILALQGDPSQILEEDDSKCDFPYAMDLIKFIRENYKKTLCLGVAGYPEKHIKSSDTKTDILRLKEKIDAGADFIITQACFDVEIIKTFAFNCKSHHINTPIIPGLFIINSYESLRGMSKFCGVPIPKNVVDVVDSNRDDQEAVREYGVNLAVSMFGQLFGGDLGLFKNVHVFTLNNLDNVLEVINRLNKV